MKVIKQYRIYRQDLKANTSSLYLFGDNLDRRGFGGQAKEMRGEPNSFGIATKRSINHNYPDDYFFDNQPDTRQIIDDEFERLYTLIANNYYNTIVIPSDGIGTGLARLPEFAPKLLIYINSKLEVLASLQEKQ